MLGSGLNLITTIIGFGMSATFIVFICTRIICRRLRQMEEAQQTFEFESGIDLELPEHRVNGLAPGLIASIPTMKFDHEAFSSIEDAQCTICLAEYEEKEVLRILPKCGHTFHLSCIDVWLAKQPTCPVCRVSLDSLETKHVQTTNMLSATESLNGSENIVENSLQWLPTAIVRSASDQSNLRLADSVSIDIDFRALDEQR